MMIRLVKLFVGLWLYGTAMVAILRAGLGMLPGVLALIPAAKVSVVGLQRDEETLQPVPYFERLTGRLEERDALHLAATDDEH